MNTVTSKDGMKIGYDKHQPSWLMVLTRFKFQSKRPRGARPESLST